MQIEYLNEIYAEEVARLHSCGITTGFLSSLGPKFLAALYKALAQNENAFGFVGCENEQVLGYIAFTDNLSRLYKTVLKQNIFRFSIIVALKMLRLSRIKKVFQVLLYPGKTQKLDLPASELLAIVIADHARGLGLATKLIQAGLEECKKRNIDRVKVLVAVDNQPANQLYLKIGFQRVSSILSHNIPSNIYVKSLL